METNSNEEEPKISKETSDTLPSLGGVEAKDATSDTSPVDTSSAEDSLDATGELTVNTDVTSKLPVGKVRAAILASTPSIEDGESVATPAKDTATDQSAGQQAATPVAEAPKTSQAPDAAPKPQSAPQSATTPTSNPSPASAKPGGSNDDDFAFAYEEEPRVTADYISTGAQPVLDPMEQTRGGGKGGKMIAVAIIAVLLVVYVGASVFFMSHFLPNTTVNGENVSVTPVDDLASRITNIGTSYQTHVEGDGIDLELAGKDIDVRYDGEAYAKAAAEQYSPWAWPLSFFQPHNLKVEQGITFDEKALEHIVDPAIQQVNENATPPTNANMTYDANEGKFVATKDALGTQIDRETTIKDIKEGVRTLQSEISLDDADLVQPALKEGDQKLTDGIKHANELVTKSIPLRVAGTDAAIIDGSLMSQWLSLNDQGNIDVNQEAVSAWTDNDLSSRFDTVGSKRTFTRPDGKVIEVEGGDLEYSYGWNIDGEALCQTILDKLKTNNLDAIEAPMLQTAAKWNPGGQEWPNKYVDVDITEQTVRLYDENSNLISESPCVSGDPARDGGTHRGVFTIYNKELNMELVGADENGDGQPDYRVPVTYWMPFDGGEGLHDVSTRSAWGGDVYTYSGSHGCVNLPYYFAAEIWENYEVGDVVVVHD